MAARKTEKSIGKKRSGSRPKDGAKPHGTPELLQVAKKYFGFAAFRPGQEEAIQAVLGGTDSLVVMPTGSGKSAIYQIAGLMLEGATVVISPLIALQKDQIDSINETDEGAAVAVNSSQRVAEAREALEKIEDGRGKYIFLAPEQLHRAETVEALQKAKVSLFVVDEAHCISEWGHDFRPDYMQLGPMLERLGHPAVLAMTATASAQVRDEIVARLGMRSPKVFVHGFDRPNIYLRVDQFETEDEKQQAIVHRVLWAEKPGIVYVGTRKNAEMLMQALDDEGMNAVFYHAGLKAAERRTIQDKFMGGEVDIIVATNAFGMGIDKANVRFVYHYDVSDSLDSYYQEIGRAGRDGEKAEAVLFFRSADIGAQKFRSGEGHLAAQEFEHVAEVIADQEGPVRPEEIADDVDLSDRKLTKVINRLEDVGAVEVLPTGELEINEEADLSRTAEAAAQEQERRKEVKRQRLLQMEEYADTSQCRRELLLRYFGDDFRGPCGNCDNCQQQTSNESDNIEVDPSVGTRREVA
jgi:ATP-dependent DNA helicase RecQ